MLAATGGLITALVGLLTFMSAPAPSIVSFDASPNMISIGESSILKWSVTGDGATVNIRPDIGTVGLIGTREVAPNITTNYTLTAKNKDQERIASVQLIVREKKEGNQMTEEKENVINKTLPAEAEIVNSNESAIVADFDSQQNTLAQTAQMAARSNDPSESTGIDQSKMRQNASLNETAPEPNASESIAHVQSGLVESSMTDNTPVVAIYSNESNPSEDSRSSAGSDDDGGVTEPKAITAADWDHLKNTPRSENDFASRAPIYDKLADARYPPANGNDFQDPAVFDPGPASSDYLSADS
jgi:hypothetical protein